MIELGQSQPSIVPKECWDKYQRRIRTSGTATPIAPNARVNFSKDLYKSIAKMIPDNLHYAVPGE
jgi:hypothetical protein